MSRAGKRLRELGVVVYPSDTVYGMCARADSRECYERVLRIKGYPVRDGVRRPMILLSDSTSGALSLALESDLPARRLADRYWPGPLTLVIPASPRCPEWLVAGDGTVAVRVPADRVSRMLLRASGSPLISTSANLSGGPSPRSLAEVPAGILEACDEVLDGGLLPYRMPSTMVRPSPDGRLTILRQGDLLVE
ncbi:L-threonylcarbamoyladenylate synthase [Candidatus Fermentibacterales bacterium]|nr:L-threonylcarbamoyladenylate synthase [Candidatus Fermentibacterales bacterium]